MKCLATLLAAAGALATAALAADEPTAFGTATRGSLRVTSGVLVSARDVDMRGVWVDETVSCRTQRRLTVAIEIDYVAPTRPDRIVRFRRTGRFRGPNCAEGGPNVGFTITPRQARFACADGRWKPGRYTFSTSTMEPTTRLEANATLFWHKPGRC